MLMSCKITAGQFHDISIQIGGMADSTQRIPSTIFLRIKARLRIVSRAPYRVLQASRHVQQLPDEKTASVMSCWQLHRLHSLHPAWQRAMDERGRYEQPVKGENACAPCGGDPPSPPASAARKLLAQLLCGPPSQPGVVIEALGGRLLKCHLLIVVPPPCGLLSSGPHLDAGGFQLPLLLQRCQPASLFQLLFPGLSLLPSYPCSRTRMSWS